VGFFVFDDVFNFRSDGFESFVVFLGKIFAAFHQTEAENKAEKAGGESVKEGDEAMWGGWFSGEFLPKVVMAMFVVGDFLEDFLVFGILLDFGETAVDMKFGDLIALGTGNGGKKLRCESHEVGVFILWLYGST